MKGRCCPVFGLLAENAGRRGLAVFVASSAGTDAFWLQSRAIDHGALDPSVPIAPDLGIPVTTVTQLAITHCPGCGVDLKREYRRQIDDLRRDELIVRG